MKKGDNCPNVCYGPHDRDIHRATVSVHEWLKKQVTLSLRAPAVGALRPPGGGVATPATNSRKRSVPVVMPRERYVHPPMTEVTVERIQELQAGGMRVTEIARTLGCSTDTVYARVRGKGSARPC